jgi:hypothetical protein
MLEVHVRGAQPAADAERLAFRLELTANTDVVIGGRRAAITSLRPGMEATLWLDRSGTDAKSGRLKSGAFGIVTKVEVANDSQPDRQTQSVLRLENAVLDEVDPNGRRITVTLAVPSQGGRPARLLDLPVSKDASVTISSRLLPSFANHVERRLDELKPSQSVSLELSVVGGDLIVAKIVGWRSE